MENLEQFLLSKNKSRLEAYKASPSDIREHAGIEDGVLAGGYAYRQILELVQNAADAINEEANSTLQPRIEVLLTDKFLYVANTGAPISEDGYNSLLQSHSSPKRANQIGRFGLGFKSLLMLKGKIDIFSQNGGMQFDPERCENEIKEHFPDFDRYPKLRLAFPINQEYALEQDTDLNTFKSWATTVIRAELNNIKIWEHIKQEVEKFPSQFLLFLSTNVSLTFRNRQDGVESLRDLRREILADGCIALIDSDKTTKWRLFENANSTLRCNVL